MGGWGWEEEGACGWVEGFPTGRWYLPWLRDRGKYVTAGASYAVFELRVVVKSARASLECGVLMVWGGGGGGGRDAPLLETKDLPPPDRGGVLQMQT